MAAAPTEWAAKVTATLASQLPEPSVPSRIFLVEKFAMKPVSGKIDRTSLPDLSQPIGIVNSEARNTSGATGIAALKLSNGTQEMGPESEEVFGDLPFSIRNAVGPDDEFSDSGGHSIVIARLAQRLRAAGWAVPVRALLSDCNTARKVADRPRELPNTTGNLADQLSSHVISSDRDEASARVLSVGYFTTLQVLFMILLYSPVVTCLSRRLPFRRCRHVSGGRRPLGFYQAESHLVLGGPSHTFRRSDLGHDY